MEISDRKKKILRAVIDDYIANAEPVGSKTISKNADLSLSPATIRHEMAELEQLGYLEQPHTSAGRIPSPRGYRMYVDELMQRHQLSLQETERINSAMRQKMTELDRLLTEAARLISQITSLPSYSVTSSIGGSIRKFDVIYVDRLSFISLIMTDTSKVRHRLFRLPISCTEQQMRSLGQLLTKTFSGLKAGDYTPELIANAVESAAGLGAAASLIINWALELLGEEDYRDVAISGASNLLSHPEYKDVDKARDILHYLAQEDKIRHLPVPKDDSMKIMIGPENVAEELKDASVVVARCDIGDNMQGLIGVVGPTRMDYARISARLQYFAQHLGRLFQADDESG
ncbi:MAG: heat-inducible transcriptional repressor HrcA [Oscillospiraceae bacterium]|jgi:heat-inducible transcriptional repressor